MKEVHTHNLVDPETGQVVASVHRVTAHTVDSFEARWVHSGLLSAFRAMEYLEGSYPALNLVVVKSLKDELAEAREEIVKLRAENAELARTAATLRQQLQVAELLKPAPPEIRPPDWAQPLGPYEVRHPSWRQPDIAWRDMDLSQLTMLSPSGESGPTG